MAFKREFNFIWYHLLVMTWTLLLLTECTKADVGNQPDVFNPTLKGHSSIVSYEGGIRKLICDSADDGQVLWLKNGVLLLDGHVTTKNPSILRSILTITPIRQEDNGIYTCIVITKVGQYSIETFDLLVTAESSSNWFLNNQSGPISAVIAVMSVIIILLAIATLFTFYTGVKPNGRNRKSVVILTVDNQYPQVPSSLEHWKDTSSILPI